MFLTTTLIQTTKDLIGLKVKLDKFFGQCVGSIHKSIDERKFPGNATHGVS